MNTTIRFGKKISLPPTSTIKHQLRMMAATDSLISHLRESDQGPDDKRTALLKITEDYRLSVDRTRLLMRRLELDRPSI